MGISKVGHFDEAEVQEIGLGDPDYPELLRAIRKPPTALRFRGSLPPNTKIIAISGSRKPPQQALQTAYRIGKMLAEHGYTLVTGLAEGCDAAATDGALSVGGNAVGVVPCGLKVLRSQPRKRLAQAIFDSGGAVISEYAWASICTSGTTRHLGMDSIASRFNPQYCYHTTILEDSQTILEPQGLV